MKTILCLLLAVGAGAGSLCFAAEDGDDVAIESCLKHWGKHPFKETHNTFRAISSNVRVFGIGTEITDDAKTAKPELILIKPNVTVMAKTTMKLLNPNGWYCLKANVAVLGKTQIDLGCKANLASSKEGTTVMGDSATGGVTVLGSAHINRLCE